MTLMQARDILKGLRVGINMILHTNRTSARIYGRVGDVRVGS